MRILERVKSSREFMQDLVTADVHLLALSLLRLQAESSSENGSSIILSYVCVFFRHLPPTVLELLVQKQSLVRVVTTAMKVQAQDPVFQTAASGLFVQLLSHESDDREMDVYQVIVDRVLSSFVLHREVDAISRQLFLTGGQVFIRTCELVGESVANQIAGTSGRGYPGLELLVWLLRKTASSDVQVHCVMCTVLLWSVYCIHMYIHVYSPSILSV